MTAYDREVIRAAHAAAPIFTANGWNYGHPDNYEPDVSHLAYTIQRLVDGLREEVPELDENGYGWVSTKSGRFHITREIQSYTYDPADDEITIALELETIEAETDDEA